MAHQKTTLQNLDIYSDVLGGKEMVKMGVRMVGVEIVGETVGVVVGMVGVGQVQKD